MKLDFVLNDRLGASPRIFSGTNMIDNTHSNKHRIQHPEHWRILIVDDERDVHEATALALRGLRIDGRTLDLLYAYSAREAYDLLTTHRDVAVVLLDVVMETDDAGLRLVERIRAELKDDAIRIVLCADRPELLPQIETIRVYDINDCKTKSELTRTGLFTCLSVAVRFYRQIRDLEEVRAHLGEQCQELTRSRTKLRAMTAHREKVREDERAYLARELHDEMGQYLTALRMEVSLLAIYFTALDTLDTEASHRLTTMRELIDHAIGATRRVISHLRPAALDLGLVSAAEWLAADFRERTGIGCCLETPLDEELELGPELATTLFRILQESLTNISHHARAQQVKIRISVSNDALRMEVCDDGFGFDLSLLREKRTFGLMGIRERVLLYDGSARIESRPGEGTCLRIVLPRHAMGALS